MTENTPQNFVIEFWVREATHIFLALFCVKMGVLTSQKCRGKRPELNVDMLTDAGVFGAEISWNFLFSFTLIATLVSLHFSVFFHFFLQEKHTNILENIF